MPYIDPVSALISLAIFLPCLTIHEFAHAWAAYIFGDNTAKDMGRLTLNPIAHIDPIGTILMPVIAHIGWAKPVPVNHTVLNRAQILLVSLAGPFSNILMALIVTIIFHILPGGEMSILHDILMLVILYNLVLAIFNLLPIPPLDGSSIIYACIKSPIVLNIYRNISNFGIFIVVGLLYFGGFDLIIWPLINLFFDVLKLPSPFI